MTKRMLIDSTHAEETRVVVLDGNRLEDYDVETSTKQQLKGNIYLAKIVRVEPSLQAAFVEFGGGRHGFLAFGEIHPDYYQIPVADRKRLLEMQEAEAREEEEEEEREALRRERGHARRQESAPAEPESLDAQPDEPPHDAPIMEPSEPAPEPETQTHADPEAAAEAPQAQPATIAQDILVAAEEPPLLAEGAEPAHDSTPEPGEPTPEPIQAETTAEPPITDQPEHQGAVETIQAEPLEAPEDLGGEHDTDDRQDRRATPRFLRNYKIQEVMRRRQILLVQVVKEERGTKGAALTTYISLAGRFSVLMPNSPRGGGISRKITSAADRRRLKEITAELDLPRGMGLIVRTAGANRPKPEIIRDCEYLLNQWDQIRDLTMKSMAPALIYEEASLIKRAIRDVYSRDVDEILVDGETGWRAAHDFMRMLMPTHARKVQLWKDPQPLFAKAQVEAQLDAMMQPTVQLRSGGYLVINQTEALVAIDVNSGRSTRERGIEETALRTNLEAAEETARQLRLRDLAGLIVIDFIDMESRRNNTAVEKRLKDSLKDDRARIQVGSISHFGLMEMSRQRLRPSLTETSFVVCAHCAGTGLVRSTETAALHVLRGIEDEGSKRRAAEIVVHVHGSIALYVLNHKRERLAEIEQRFGMHVTFHADDAMVPPLMRIEKIRAQTLSEGPAPISQLPPPEPFDDPDEELPTHEESTHEEPLHDEIKPEPETSQPETIQIVEAAPPAPEPTTESTAEPDEDEPDRPGETPEEGDQRRKKRRRRRRGGRREEAAPTTDAPAADAGAADAPASDTPPGETPAPQDGETPEDASAEGERKRRGRRGGRRRRRDAPAGEQPTTEAQPEPEAQTFEPEPVIIQKPMAYVGPTPADPFGGDTNQFAFFDAVEEAEEVRAGIRPAPTPKPVAATPPPAIAPIVVGATDAPPVEKKRGWWRS